MRLTIESLRMSFFNAAFISLPLTLKLSESSLAIRLALPCVLAIVFVLAGWAIRLSTLFSGMTGDISRKKLVLVGIRGSHFVEKVRWCLDRAGLQYNEVRHIKSGITAGETEWFFNKSALK